MSSVIVVNTSIGERWNDDVGNSISAFVAGAGEKINKAGEEFGKASDEAQKCIAKYKPYKGYASKIKSLKID